MAAATELRQRQVVERSASPVSFSGSTSDEDEIATFTPPNFTVSFWPLLGVVSRIADLSMRPIDQGIARCYS